MFHDKLSSYWGAPISGHPLKIGWSALPGRVTLMKTNNFKEPLTQTYGSVQKWAIPVYPKLWPYMAIVESCWIMLNHNVKREHDQILIQHDFVVDVVNFLPVRVAWGWTAWACLRGWHTRHCAGILEVPGIWRSLKSCGTRKAFQNWQSSIFFVWGDPGFWETPTLPLFVYFQAVTVRSESVGYCANQLQSHRDMADEVTMWPAKSFASCPWGATKCMRCRCCLLNCHGPLDSTQDDSCRTPTLKQRGFCTHCGWRVRKWVLWLKEGWKLQKTLQIYPSPCWTFLSGIFSSPNFTTCISDAHRKNQVPKFHFFPARDTADWV